MFVILPVGVENAAVHRPPWISIGIASTFALVFALTWVMPTDPGGLGAGRLEDAVRYWYDRPDLKFPAELENWVDAEELKAMEQGRVHVAELKPRLPGADARLRVYARDPQKEQEALNAMAAEITASVEQSPLTRYALVPARGAAQIGWFTHLFLHRGWLHLLRSLFFLFLVAALLEDAWGRMLFLGFYLIGGVGTAVAYTALAWQSSVPYLGAAGAIAACMGAFAYRFAFRKIRMVYFGWFFGVLRGGFLLPAWVWGLLWFLSEVSSLYWNRGQGKVAVMAHLGGFGFGFLVAMALKLSRIEARYIAPAVEKQQEGWTEHPGIVLANHALAQRDLLGAEKAFQEVLGTQVDHLEANLGLSRIELQSKREAAGLSHLERALRQLLATSQNDRIFQLFLELEKQIQPMKITPALALRLAALMEKGPDALRPTAEALYLAAGRAGGLLGARGMIRVAELRLERRDLSASTQRLLADLQQIPELDEMLKKRLALLLDQAEPLRAELAAAPPPEEPPTIIHFQGKLPEAGPSGRKNQTVPCRLISLTQDEIRLAADTGHKTNLPLKRIKAIAVGVVQEKHADPSQPARAILVVDLVVPRGSGPGADSLLLRMDSRTIPFALLYPQVSPVQASQQFLSQLLERSGAQALPDRSTIEHGQYPRFANIKAFEDTFYP